MPPELVRVFDVEPDLLTGLSRRAAEEAARTVAARVFALEPGDWRPPLVRLGRGDLALLIVDGIILRRVEVIGRTGVELLGAGDIVRPWRLDEESQSVPATLSVRVCRPTRVAVLDRDFVEAVSGWPEILARILDRLSTRATSLTFQLAIAQLPQLESRLLCLLWRLADRWGRMSRDGVSLRLELSQQTLAELVSAHRASVSSALGRLERRGALAREARGHYRLLGDPPSETAHLLARDLAPA